jgi:two-component system, cell cycle response regulator CtrA
MRVLIIEDDPVDAASMELMLKSESFNAYSTDTGEDGVELAKLYDYDVITLDLTLPDMPGVDVIRQIRAAKVRTPILVLCALASIEDKVRALALGADDYMTKPFHKDELIARLRALVRRSKGHAHSVITTGNLSVNLDTKRAAVNGIDVPLTGKEYQMLELLSLRKGAPLTKEMFLNHLYGGRDEPEVKIIDVFVCKLRKKLMNATEGEESFIKTVWGRGYLLEDATAAPVDMSAEVASLADDPPTGFVPNITLSSHKFKQAFGGKVGGKIPYAGKEREMKKFRRRMSEGI